MNENLIFSYVLITIFVASSILVLAFRRVSVDWKKELSREDRAFAGLWTLIPGIVLLLLCLIRAA